MNRSFASVLLVFLFTIICCSPITPSLKKNALKSGKKTPDPAPVQQCTSPTATTQKTVEVPPATKVVVVIYRQKILPGDDYHSTIEGLKTLQEKHVKLTEDQLAELKRNGQVEFQLEIETPSVATAFFQIIQTMKEEYETTSVDAKNNPILQFESLIRHSGEGKWTLTLPGFKAKPDLAKKFMDNLTEITVSISSPLAAT